MTNDIGQTLITSLTSGLAGVIAFIPKLIVGIIIILLGIIISSILRQIVVEFFKALKVEQFLKRYGVPEAKEDFTWTNILAEIVKWFAFVLFLIPAADVWGLPQVTTVLNTFLLYLPNVFVSAIIGVVGFAFAKLAHNVILASTQNLSADTSRTIATVARWAIIIFVFLAILSQLGVASDLIRILFTGFVAMVAVAGGIAFGLGGQGTAKDILENLQKKLK